jgi:hypothetical protein
MPFPAGIDSQQVTHTYLRGDGSPAAGQLTWTPDFATKNEHLASGTTFVATPLVFTLDTAGGFAATLLSTADTDLETTGWTWHVVEEVDGQVLDYHAHLDHTALPDPADLRALAQVAKSEGS